MALQVIVSTARRGYATNSEILIARCDLDGEEGGIDPNLDPTPFSLAILV